MKKIAIMLPIGYQGGSLRAAKNIAKAIAFQAHAQGHDIQVIFSYVQSGSYNIHADFDDLTQAGIALRETVWKVLPKKQLQSAANLVGISETRLEHSSYCLPSDGINDFYDCDLWIIISDRIKAPLFPLRKHAFVIYDYIQRYVPEIWGDSNDVWDDQVSNLMYSIQQAAKVFVTTPSTQQDLISYAGVHPSRVHLLEMEFQPLDAGKLKINADLPEKYILWPTNTTYHKNHINAFDAIEMYVQEFDSDLHFIITGTWTEYFDPDNEFAVDDPVVGAPQVQYVREKIRKDPLLAKKIHIMGKVSDKMYARLLQGAQFLWHPTFYDNGTFAVIEAAYLGVPSLSARYPAMKYIDQKFDLNLQFFDPRNPKEMAESLFNMETGATSIPLPSQTALLQRDWKTLSLPLYQAVLELLW